MQCTDVNHNNCANYLGFGFCVVHDNVGGLIHELPHLPQHTIIIIMFIRITSRTDSTIMKISGAIKTSVRAAVHNYYPKTTKEKGTNSTQKTAVAYRFRKEIYRILSCT